MIPKKLVKNKSYAPPMMEDTDMDMEQGVPSALPPPKGRPGPLSIQRKPPMAAKKPVKKARGRG